MSGIYFPSSTTSNNAIAFQSLVGPLVSVGEISALGGTFSKYETNFGTYEAQHWSSDGVSWATSNYYDRAFIEYQWYARTGDVTYLNRGNAIAEDYLHNYVEANNYKVASWWSMPKGITAHYLLNGDAASLTAIGKIADGVCIPWNCNNNWANLTDPHFAEGREQARALETLTQAILIDAPSQDGHDFRAMAKSLVEKLLSDQQAVHERARERGNDRLLRAGQSRPAHHHPCESQPRLHVGQRVGCSGQSVPVPRPGACGRSDLRRPGPGSQWTD